MSPSKPDAWALRAAEKHFGGDEGDEVAGWELHLLATIIQREHEAAGWEALRDAAIEAKLRLEAAAIWMDTDAEVDLLRAALARVEENR